MLSRRIAPLLVLLVPATAAAQAPPPPGQPPVVETPVEKPTRFGLKLGLNAAILENDIDPASDGPALDGEAMMTFAVGATIVHKLNPNMSIMLELMYLQKGSSYDLSEFGIDSAKTTLNYIEAPMLGRYELSPGAPFNPYIFGGGALGYYIGGENEFDGETNDIDDDLVAKIDVGIVVGAGAEMPAGGMTLIGDLRYTHGLIDLDTSEGGTDFISKSRVITLMAGFLF